MRQLARAIQLTVVLTVAVVGPADATHQLVRGKLFLVKDPSAGTDPARRRVVVVGREPAPGEGESIVGDPTAAIGGGAFLQVVANGEVGTQSEVYPMPTAGWQRIPGDLSKPLLGYSYVDRAPGTHGPVRRAVLKRKADGRFLVKVILVGTNGPGPQPHIAILPPDPGVDGGATLSINNGDSYCVMFGGDAGGRVLNKPPSPPQDEVFRIASTALEPTAEAGCVEVHCPASAGEPGNCCWAHETPGCSDPECCHRVSDHEHMCASTAWTAECVRIAEAVCGACGGSPDTCGNGVTEGAEACDPPDGFSCASDCTPLAPSCTGGTETCCAEHASPGCTDQACCEAVCESDPRCCWFGWDASCAAAATTLCGSCPGSACGAFVGDCCSAGGSSGCGDASCCQTVCDLDSSCCGGGWDAACVALAAAACSSCGAPVCPAPGGCFGEHANPGCNQTSCCEQVCTLRPACCSGAWDAQCVAVAAQECTPYAGTIDIEINATQDIADDYLTWSPTIARLRVRDREPNSDLTVELSNAAANGAGGRGKVRFATYPKAATEWPDTWAANTTATQATVTRTLPQTGEWVSFVVAGESGKPSDGLNGTNGRDTTIEARAGGDLVGSHNVMVRVRKNVASLSAGERTRFVDTVKALHTKKGYQVLQDMHRDGWFFSSDADDFIHNNPAFITWHRAQILHFERALQAINPAVTLPYWNSDEAVPGHLFAEGFMGAIEPKTCAKMCASGADGGKLCDVTSVAECMGNGAPHVCCTGAGMGAGCITCAGGAICGLRTCASGDDVGSRCDVTTLAECTGVGMPWPCCTGVGAGATCRRCDGGATCALKELCKLKGNFSEADWTVAVEGTPTPVRRVRHAFTGTPTNSPPSAANNSGPFTIAPEANATGAANYVAMRRILEGGIHNLAHLWVGGIHESMRTTVVDPVFFLYHSNHDRIWARWQVAHRGAGTATEYNPQGAFDAAKGVSRMAYLDGTFWPWNGQTSKNGNCTNAGCGRPTPPPCCSNTMVDCTTVQNESSECPDFPSGWPTTAPGGGAGFPAPPGGAKLGPGKTPKVSDVIDYEGRVDPTKGLGYCYDDTAY